MNIAITPLQKVFIIILLLSVSCKKKDLTLSSPNGRIMAAVEINDDGQISFRITSNDMDVLQSSRMGIVREDADFSANLSLEKVSKTKKVSDSYEMKHGKQRHYQYEANEKIYQFTNQNGESMEIIFRVSNQGVAYRYSFPEKSDDIKKITRELSAFSFPEGTATWIQPRAKAKSGWESSNPSYEENYQQNIKVTALESTETGWVFPALFKTGEQWLLISETAPDKNYCGTRLLKGDQANELVIGFPEEVEHSHGGQVNPESTLPWLTPWRIVAIGNLSEITASTLGTDLAAPALYDDIAYVIPGRSSWSWVMLKEDSIIYDVQKRFIDYSADMGWEYSLIDVNWDTQIGYDKIKELSEYAAEKNVGLLLWYNSAGDWNTTPYHPRDMLLTSESRQKEFSRLREMGIRGIKIDFFGGDGQSVMKYYQEIFEDAHQYQLMVNCHGSTLPRGWQRTYPNLVTMEAIKGFEFVTFEQSNADQQPITATIAPFSRNVFDPMDFTPMGFSEIPGINRLTSNAFELATAVIFLSGVQHYAETDRGMAAIPVYVKEMIKEIPVAWEESHLVDGFPGKLVVIARKKGDSWFVAGLNGENMAKDITFSLPFVETKKGSLITDGGDNRTFIQHEVLMDDTKQLNVQMIPYGGFVMKF